MFPQQSGAHSQLEQIAKDADHLLKNLLSSLPSNDYKLNWLDGFDELVDCMMLGTAEHGLAKLRINNARRFIRANELGAAKFEIRQLKGGLKHQLRFNPSRQTANSLPGQATQAAFRHYAID